MSNKQGLQARNQQAARDALRRRQKAKKARQVKRHVRYKEKKRLLDELEAGKVDSPIVANELRRLGEDEDEKDDVHVRPRTQQSNKKQNTEVDGFVCGEESDKVELRGSQSAQIEDDVEQHKMGLEAKKTQTLQGDKKKKKFVPFTKQMKQAENARKEREKKEREHQIRISTRENMLKKSKKERGKRVSCVVLQIGAHRYHDSWFTDELAKDMDLQTCRRPAAY